MAELDREKVLDNVTLDLEISKDDDDSIDLLRVLLNRVISHFKAEYAVAILTMVFLLSLRIA